MSGADRGESPARRISQGTNAGYQGPAIHPRQRGEGLQSRRRAREAEIIPGRTIDLWGYNGSAPGPTIQVNQGDRFRIVFDNHLAEPTSMHWHGFEIPNDMDGAPRTRQDPVTPDGRFVYEFTLHQEGTYFYHPHMAIQEMMGMLGAFIMHPKTLRTPSSIRIS